MAKTCCVLYIAGQSNAHAHNQRLEEKDVIKTPLKNVHILNREYNQSLTAKSVKWSGYSSYNGNLGESQDCTYSLAHFLAKSWQNGIDNGKPLPDLYIVQISLGAQAVFVGYYNYKDGVGMWNPNRKLSLISGDVEHADISLYPLALNTYENVHKDLTERYEKIIPLGLVFLGLEEDTSKKINLFVMKKTYKDFFSGLINATGFNPTLYLNKLPPSKRINEKNRKRLIRALKSVKRNIKNTKFIDIEKSDLFSEKKDNFGIYCNDKIHYTLNVQEYLATKIFNDNFGEIL